MIIYFIAVSESEWVWVSFVLPAKQEHMPKPCNQISLIRALMLCDREKNDFELLRCYRKAYEIIRMKSFQVSNPRKSIRKSKEIRKTQCLRV